VEGPVLGPDILGLLLLSRVHGVLVLDGNGVDVL